MVGVLICNSVQLKKKENTFLKKQEKKKPGKPGNLGVSVKPQIRSPRSFKTESRFIA